MIIKLIHSPEPFHLIEDGTAFTTILKDAALFIRKVKLNPNLSTEHNKILIQGKHAKYPVRRGVVSTCTIPQASMSMNKDNVLHGQLPNRVVVGLISNRAFNGSVERNPFEFKHFDVNYFA